MKRFFLIFLICYPLFVSSQGNSQYGSTKHIEKMNSTLNMKFGLDNDAESFVFENAINRYSIEPNINTRVVISAYYRFISLKVGFAPKFLSNIDTGIKGKTNMFKIQGDIFFKNWLQSFEYLNVKGYFINDKKNLIAPIIPPLEDFQILPNLGTVSLSGSLGYKFNDDFSLKALLNQNEIQRRSAGSTISSLNYGYFKMLDKTQDINLRSYSIALHTGYIYTYVLNRKWYSSIGIIPGLGKEYNKRITKVEEENILEKDNNFVFHLNAHFGLGYNSRKVYGGAFLKGITANRGKNSLIGFNTARGIFQLYIGYRFKAPKPLKEGFDWLEDQIPIK
ncbi:MAG: DUF4421 domain-containing protein [Flavobacteriaceae bacterium]|nr:DUF4421 domain-containing protein [Flavobacteriaceae bacterium]